jgi:hypothetical protein
MIKGTSLLQIASTFMSIIQLLSTAVTGSPRHSTSQLNNFISLYRTHLLPFYATAHAF